MMKKKIKYVTRLQKLQTRAAKLISGSGHRANRNLIYKSLDLLSIQHRRDYNKCILVYKSHNNLAPPYLVDMFNSNDSVPHTHVVDYIPLF